MCEVKFCFCEKDNLQVVHVKGLSPACIHMCLMRLDLSENDLPHTQYTSTVYLLYEYA